MAARAFAVLLCWALALNPAITAAVTPKWPVTYDMKLSSVIMPCNDSGFLDPTVAAKWGLVDFDWSNAKGAWTLARPMDCEERLVEQAKMVKSVSPQTRVWVYRNLVKALPWYSSVREKILDPAYSGFFLKFKQPSTLPNGSSAYHVPDCTPSKVGEPTKCSVFYHDQEQTPVNGGAPPQKDKLGWTIYNPYNGVSGMHPDNTTVWKAPGPPSAYATWQQCEAAAEAAQKTIPEVRLFTWWGAPSGGGGTCWLSHQLHAGHYGPEQGHVMGYKGPPADAPAIERDYNECEGDCDCGDGLPCGEYLWDHRNGSMLREFLINEFVLSNKTGLRNEAVDGFFFDDGWSDKPDRVPPWAPPTYRQCNMWKTGGATEEDYYCVVDMGLTQADVTEITQEHDATMTAVYDAVIANGGFAWPLLTSREASLDLNDPRPAAKCTAYLRSQCQAGVNANRTLMFGFTRKSFQDAFPLPLVEQDVAQFLLVRGPFAFIGHSWMGCIKPDGFVQGNTSKGYVRPPEIDVDYGVPTDDHCSETSSGVFEREWSKASVKMDCNGYTATIRMK